MFTHEIRIQRSRVPYIIGACLAAVLAALMLVPLPNKVRAGFAVQPAELTEVKAGRAGTVEKVNLSEGDTADAGTVLAKLDTSELDKKVQELNDEVAIAERKRQGVIARNRGAAKAQAELQKAQAASKAAEAELARATDKAGSKKPPKLAALKKKADGLQAAVEKAQKAFDAAAPKTPEIDEQVKKLGEELDQVKAELARSNIETPRTGVVSALKLKPGQKVTEGERVAKVGDLTPLRVMLAPKGTGTFEPGQAVELLLPDGALHTTLVAAGTSTAEARIDNKDGKIKLTTEGEAIITAQPRPLIHFH